ncbi:hypothetical protein OSB04_009488 [Centaurea solstitialis]|uniref:Dihydrodipicolinate reductase N-terminal domain-containing protein n=1 Tax=Centaurea solstitialis TaxID=347529 RepID=A0AA38T7E0_9ASTR|nr:hypothetical protein OSB04_009488 [Centaurea solstitialis]
MAFVLEVPVNLQQNLVSFSRSRQLPSKLISFTRKQRCKLLMKAAIQSLDEKRLARANDLALPIMVNSCTGKMGRAVIEAGISAGLHIVPASFGVERDAGKTIQVGGKDIRVHGPSDRETALSSLVEEYPNLIIVDFTVPNTGNDNAELYCKTGVPFVMGTTGGDRDL